MKVDKKNARDLVKSAYEFGYFVGYKGHSEWAEWVRNVREDLYSNAEKLGVYELVRKAYLRGKQEGAKKREEEINLGLIERGRMPEGVKEKRLEASYMTEIPVEEFEREIVEFLSSTRLTLPPDLLNTLKHLRPPKILRMDD